MHGFNTDYILFLLWALTLVQCAPVNEDDGEITIGISFETLQTEYWVASVNALRAACDERGVGYLEAVADGDANRQFEQVNTLIARGVDGLVVAPKDGHTVIPIIKAANRAGIPIAIYNRRAAPNAGEYTVVVADNYEITLQTVRHLAELAKAEGRKRKAMILIGDLGDINAVQRRAGFKAAVAEYPELIEVVSEIPTEWNQEKALAGVTNGLQAHPDIDFIFTSSDFLFPSLTAALRNAEKWHPVGHPDHVLLAGFDGDATAYRLLREGYLDADGVQDVFLECRMSVDAVLDRLAGKPVDTLLVDPGFVIHQGNLDSAAVRMWGAR